MAGRSVKRQSDRRRRIKPPTSIGNEVKPADVRTSKRPGYGRIRGSTDIDAVVTKAVNDQTMNFRSVAAAGETQTIASYAISASIQFNDRHRTESALRRPVDNDGFRHRWQSRCQLNAPPTASLADWVISIKVDDCRICQYCCNRR